MVRALKLVGAGFKAELAAILHLRMAARIVQATRLQCATRELAQVQVVVVHACCIVLCILFRADKLRFVRAHSTPYGHTHSSTTLQTALSRKAKRTADGPRSGHALKLVTVGLRAELAASLRLQMAAGIV